MNTLSEEQLSKKINSFLSRKLEQHNMKGSDGVRGNKLWSVDAGAKRTWQLISSQQF